MIHVSRIYSPMIYKKSHLANAFFATLMYICSIAVPVCIAGSRGVSAVESFCEDNSELCDLYDHGDSSLVSAVKSPAYLAEGDTVFYSILAAVGGILFSGLFILLKSTKKPWEMREEENLAPINLAGESTPLVRNTGSSLSSCYNFFKYNKKYIVESIVIGTVLSALCCLALKLGSDDAVFTSAEDVSNIICSSLKSQCGGVYPEATHLQLLKMAQFSESAFTTMTNTVHMNVSLLFSILGTALPWVIGSCLFHRERQRHAQQDTTPVPEF